MSPTVVRADAFSARLALRRLGAFGLVGGAIATAHLAFGIGIACPLRSLTGILCPFCGATRATGALVRFDIAQAWAHNALLVTVVPVLAALAVAWLVEVLGGPALRPPKAVRPVTQNKIYLVVGAIALAFMVVRNLL